MIRAVGADSTSECCSCSGMFPDPVVFPNSGCFCGSGGLFLADLQLVPELSVCWRNAGCSPIQAISQILGSDLISRNSAWFLDSGLVPVVVAGFRTILRVLRMLTLKPAKSSISVWKLRNSILLGSDLMPGLVETSLPQPQPPTERWLPNEPRKQPATASGSPETG
jgi:hypothetical protein